MARKEKEKYRVVVGKAKRSLFRDHFTNKAEAREAIRAAIRGAAYHNDLRAIRSYSKAKVIQLKRR